MDIKKVIKTENNNYFLLTEIINNSNIKIFKKDGIKYAINTNNFDISTSSLGSYFDIDIRPYILGEIIDTN
jgi:hypothetical protein